MMMMVIIMDGWRWYPPLFGKEVKGIKLGKHSLKIINLAVNLKVYIRQQRALRHHSEAHTLHR